MSNCIGWNQLTPAQQQMIPAEYKNKDIPKSVIEQNNIALTASQWSVFSASPVQNDVTNYKLPESETQTQNNSFWGKAANVAQKLVVGSGVGVVVGFLASMLFPVGGAVACGIIAGIGGYLYASKKANQTQQQATQNQQTQNAQTPAQKTTSADKSTDAAKTDETKTSEASTTSGTKSAAELKADAKAYQDKYGVTREGQKKWADYYEANLAEAIASGDSARIKAAQEAEDKFYRENPGYAKSVGKGSGASTASTSTTSPASSTTSSSESGAATTTSTSSSSDINSKSVRDLTKEERADRIKNPKPGSTLATLYKEKADLESEKAKKTDKRQKELWDGRIDGVEAKIKETIDLYDTLIEKIEKLEKEATAEAYKQLPALREQLENLF